MNPIVFVDHLVIMLHVPLFAKSVIMNVYKVYILFCRNLSNILYKVSTWHFDLMLIMPPFHWNATF